MRGKSQNTTKPVSWPPAARWPLAVVMNGERGLGSQAPMKLFPLKDTPLIAAGFFIAVPI
jgi:hypothetical protein